MATRQSNRNTTTSEDKQTLDSPKKFSNSDLIPCKSVTSGELIMVGAKTGIVYKWANCDDIEEVEYQDLLYATRQRSSYVIKPYFIVLDKDFVEQNKELNALYQNLYSYQELNEILALEPQKMKKVISSLPVGIQDALKGIAATKINEGTFDSVNRIKVLDEIFGTSMLQVLVENS